MSDCCIKAKNWHGKCLRCAECWRGNLFAPRECAECRKNFLMASLPDDSAERVSGVILRFTLGSRNAFSMFAFINFGFFSLPEGGEEELQLLASADHQREA